LSIDNLITDHIETWTTAQVHKKSGGRGRSKKSNGQSQYGITKLRELILELAVRGKLVPQDSNDEPTDLLLKSIANERNRLAKQKSIKRPKQLAPISDEEKPFAIPPSWKFTRLNNLGEWGAGATPSRRKSEYYEGNIPWFKSGELVDDFISSSEEHITDLALKETSVRYNNIGDVLIAMYGATIGKTSILEVKATTNQAVCACTPFLGFSNTFLLTLLKAFKGRFIGMGAGGAQPNISREKLIATVIPLPPLAEQHRIVAKVDKLMALCDQLEQEQTDNSETHQLLVKTLLDTLTNATDHADFIESWQRIETNFDILFTTEASIDKLKQTILQLAVMGKLVPQDPNNEPASVLLEKIAKEKARLVKKGKIKKQKPLPEIGEEEKPFELPLGWEWVRFGSLVNYKSELVQPHDFLDIDQVAPDSIEKGSGKLLFRRTVLESGIRGPNNRFYAGQILYSKIRPSLSKAVLIDFDGLCSADMYPIESMIDPRFLLKQILSEVFLIQVRIAENRIKMPKLNIESLSNILVPLPPSKEHLRIVSKIDEMTKVCDSLKERLNVAQATQVHLADTLAAFFATSPRKQ